MKRSQYICQDCGAVARKWSGRCESCSSWNSIIEEIIQESAPKAASSQLGKQIDFKPLMGQTLGVEHHPSGISEFDCVLGGGLVQGATLLVAGEPGIGKSTLLLQVAASIANETSDKGAVIYISGEEAIEQIRQRAYRLGLDKASAKIATATDIRDILSTLEETPPRVVVIDSIQTMFTPELDSAPGSVSQVRGCAQSLINQSKRQGSTLILLGHVTKEGLIAGPRVLEHMVDTVITFEGERGHQFRILRSTKNRFGPSDEIGVFSMTEMGLKEVPNPSALFLSEKSGGSTGSVVFAGIEGSRPVLAEIQALVAPSPLGTPRRSVLGWDQARLGMVLAVLDARCGISMGKLDVYLNVTGGLRIQEPGMDLAAAAALVSSFKSIALPEDVVIYGELGLSGGVRAVNQPSIRLKESIKLGFKNAWTPPAQKKISGNKINLVEFEHISEMVNLIQKQAQGAEIKTFHQKGSG